MNTNYYKVELLVASPIALEEINNIHDYSLFRRLGGKNREGIVPSSLTIKRIDEEVFKELDKNYIPN